MSFNWSEYLGLAQQLAGKAKISATQESRLRSAISRSYYAAFIQARNYLRDEEGIVIPNKNTHQYVINQFNNSSELNRKKIAQQLKRLRDYRNQADYDDTFQDLPVITKRSLKLAAQIIGKLANL